MHSDYNLTNTQVPSLKGSFHQLKLSYGIYLQQLILLHGDSPCRVSSAICPAHGLSAIIMFGLSRLWQLICSAIFNCQYTSCVWSKTNFRSPLSSPLGGLSSKQSSKHPKFKYETIKSMQFLSIFWMPSPPVQTQSPLRFWSPVWILTFNFCFAPLRHYRNSPLRFSFFTALFSWITNKNLQQHHCSSFAMHRGCSSYRNVCKMSVVSFTLAVIFIKMYNYGLLNIMYSAGNNMVSFQVIQLPYHFQNCMIIFFFKMEIT